jgi:hypothetical protein
MRIELYGCPFYGKNINVNYTVRDCLFFTIGGVISYTVSPSTDKDNAYDGRLISVLFYVIISFCVGGIGRLTDGIIGSDETTWLAWNTSPMSIQFHFDTFRHFKIIRIYSMNNKYRSIQIKFDNNLPIKHHMSPMTTSLSTMFVDTVQLSEYGTMIIGKRVEILFEFDNELLFLTEITFDNEPTMIVNTTLTSITTTTTCATGKKTVIFELKQFEFQ